MKQKISITIEEKVLKKLADKLEGGLFRNKSHVIEYALRKFLERKSK